MFRRWLTAVMIFFAGAFAAASAAVQDFGDIALNNSDITYDTVSTEWNLSLLKIDTDSTTAMVVEQSGGEDVFVVDTSTPLVVVGSGVAAPLLLGHTAADAGGGVSTLVQSHAGDTTSGLGSVTWSADANGPLLSMAKSRNATKGSHTLVQLSDSLGRVSWYGDDGVDLATEAARIETIVQGTPSDDEVAGLVRISAATNADPSVLTTVAEFDAATTRLYSAGGAKFYVNANIFGGNSSGTGALLNEAATNTNPSVIPDRAELNTGLGGDAAGPNLSGIADGTEVWRATSTGLVVSPTAVNSIGLYFGDADSGFYESSDDNIIARIAGATLVNIASTGVIVGTVTGGNPKLVAEVASGTNPVHTFQLDDDTGIGSNAANELSGIAGGAEAWRADTDATAGNTRFWLYDVDGAALKRVSVGVADSGGAGYKLLRVQN
jgi:hypothetical protein